MTMTRIRCHACIVCLFAMAAISSGSALADDPSEKDFAAFCKKETAEIEARLAAIPAGAANDPLLAAARSAAKDIDAAVAEAVESLDRVRSTAVGGMVGEAIGVSSRKPTRAVAVSHADQVRDVYVKYHEHLTMVAAAASADSPEAILARRYIDAVLAAAEKFIFIRAGEVEALGGGNAAAAEWATLVPMLRCKDAAWNKELVSGLPEWMRKAQSLRAAEYVCLCSGRPMAAYHLWVHQVSGDQEATLGLESYLASLHRRSNAYFGSKDFLKGIAILKAMVVLADSAGMSDEAVKTRFRLADVYTMYGHTQLAADEMKLVMAAYPNHKEHGRAALTRLKYLYESGLFDKILEETPAMLEDKAATDYRPQIIYIAWVANRRQDKPEAADELQRRLIRDYPEHPLCADMYFSSAMNLLAAGDYAGASRLLDMIAERYDKTPIAARSRAIMERLKASQQQTSGATVAPSGG